MVDGRPLNGSFVKKSSIYTFILFKIQCIIKDLPTYSRVTMRGQMFEPMHFDDALSSAIANLKVSIL